MNPILTQSEIREFEIEIESRYPFALNDLMPLFDYYYAQVDFEALERSAIVETLNNLEKAQKLIWNSPSVEDEKIAELIKILAKTSQPLEEKLRKFTLPEVKSARGPKENVHLNEFIFNLSKFFFKGGRIQWKDILTALNWFNYQLIPLRPFPPLFKDVPLLTRFSITERHLASRYKSFVAKGKSSQNSKKLSLKIKEKIKKKSAKPRKNN